MARPTKFSPALAKGLLALVRQHGFIAPAARAMGLHRDTVYAWRDKSAAGDPEYGDFAEQLRKAQGEWECETLGKVQSPEWLLERLDPETYGRPQPSTVVNVSQSQGLLGMDEARRELQALAASGGLKQLVSGDPALARLLAEVADGETESGDG